MHRGGLEASIPGTHCMFGAAHQEGSRSQNSIHISGFGQAHPVSPEQFKPVSVWPQVTFSGMLTGALQSILQSDPAHPELMAMTMTQPCLCSHHDLQILLFGITHKMTQGLCLPC